MWYGFNTFEFTVMIALSIETIVDTNAHINPRSTLHPTTIAYIQDLLQYYAEVIERATNIADPWIALTFPPTLANVIRFGIAQMTPMLTPDQDPERLRSSRLFNLPLAMTKVTVISVLIKTILTCLRDTDYDYNRVVLPWDIQEAIARGNTDLSTTFNITVEDRTLPVDITVNAQAFTHILTEELTIGLVSFARCAHTDLHITMFNTLFSSDFLFPTDGEEDNKILSRYNP